MKNPLRMTGLVGAFAAASLSLGACSGGSVPEQAATSGAETAAADGATFVGNEDQEYYMVTFLSGFPFWKDTFRGFEDAAKQLGVKAVYAGTTEYDVNAALNSFEQVTGKNPAGVAVTAMDADAYVDPINRAVDAGIPIVTFDSDAPDSKRAAFIGTGNYAAGAEVAHNTADLLGSEGGKVGVVTLLGQTNINDRIQGFTDTIEAEYPSIEVVDVVDSGQDEASAGAATANLLKANPDLDVIFAAQVTAQVGAIQALNESGQAGEIDIVTFDSDEVTLQNIEAGTVAFSVAQGPYHMGYWSMMMLYAMHNNTVNPVENWKENGIAPLPPTTDSGAFLINKDNVQAYLESIPKD